MKKIPAWKIGKETGKTTQEVCECGERVTGPNERTGRFPVVWYIPEAAERVKQALVAPLTVAKRYPARGLHEARNPRWIFCTIEGLQGKHPVIIPRKLQGRLIHKEFEVEAIQDVNGTTYRHVLLAAGARL